MFKNWRMEQKPHHISDDEIKVKPTLKYSSETTRLLPSIEGQIWPQHLAAILGTYVIYLILIIITLYIPLTLAELDK